MPALTFDPHLNRIQAMVTATNILAVKGQNNMHETAHIGPAFSLMILRSRPSISPMSME